MASYLSVCFVVQAVIIFLGGVLHIYNPKLPRLFQDLLLYGKTKGKRKGSSIVRNIEVPKRWFLHFYIIGTVVNVSAFLLACAVYMYGVAPPKMIATVLRTISQTPKIVSTDAISAIICIGLMAIQNIRRLLESLFVSVYSKGTMNLLHYLMGFLLYSSFSLAVLSEAQPLTRQSVNLVSVKWNHIAGILVFCLASWQHYRSHVILADLRKEHSQGDTRVKSYGHRIPRGGWFEYVSCPHYFFEIIIYLAFITVCGFQNMTLWSIVLFVVTNQCVAGVVTHRWYLSEFKSYHTLQRTAVIPFLL